MVCRVFIKRVDTANPPIQPNPPVPTLFMPTCQWEFFFTVGVFAFCKPSSCQVTPPIVTPQIKGEYMQLHSNVSEQCESVRFTVFPQQLVQSMSENTVQCEILNSQMQYIQCNTYNAMQPDQDPSNAPFGNLHNSTVQVKTSI